MKVADFTSHLNVSVALNLETSIGREKGMQAHSSNASCNRCVSASMRVIGVHGEMEKFVVITMEGVNAENAGAIFCHLAGDKSFFYFATTAMTLEVRFHGRNG